MEADKGIEAGLESHLSQRILALPSWAPSSWLRVV